MQNLEIKCRYADHDRGARLARDLGADLHGRLAQTDTYFNIRPGRLKLRHTRSGPVERCELIYYRRWNRPTAKTSDYELLPIADGPRTLDFFAAALGVLVRVDKERVVYVKDNLRIHLDEVPPLGRFLEFELIVTAAHPREECRARMQELLRMFGIAPADLVKVSYSDLLLAAKK
ncbi:MAG TPA: class IV adenylate cyclase [Gemmataceae bacterium]|nr:class IV adenylate cyclase [Gemmataceae bacterium]